MNTIKTSMDRSTSWKWLALIFFFFCLISCGGTSGEKGGEPGSKDAATMEGSNNTFFPPVSSEGGGSEGLGPEIQPPEGDFGDHIFPDNVSTYICHQGTDFSRTLTPECSSEILVAYDQGSISMEEFYAVCLDNGPGFAQLDGEKIIPVYTAPEVPSWLTDDFPEIAEVLSGIPTDTVVYRFDWYSETDIKGNVTVFRNTAITYVETFKTLDLCGTP
jgi:hypothetical protein